MKKKITLAIIVLATLLLGAARLAPPKEGPPREETPCYLLASVVEDITYMRDEGATLESVQKLLIEGISDPKTEKMMIKLAQVIYQHPEIDPTGAKNAMLEVCREVYNEAEAG